jgi:dimethylamine/trimethylamine dehydrogenase
MDFTGENLFLIPQLHNLGVEIFSGHLIGEIRDEKAIGFSGTAPEVSLTWSFDSLVLVTSRVPNDGLYKSLVKDARRLEDREIESVFRVGDCYAPRLYVADAIFDGHRLAREIDSEDPAKPLPFLRERAIV